MSDNTRDDDRRPIPVTLESLAELGQVWVKACNFDHAHVALVSHAVLVTAADGTVYKRTLSTYNGTATMKVLARFTELPGRPLADPAREIATLTKHGYTLANPPAPEAPAPKRRGGRKAAAR